MTCELDFQHPTVLEFQMCTHSVIFLLCQALTWRSENWFKVHSWPWRQQLQKKTKHTHEIHLGGTLESLIMWHNHCYQMEVIVRVRNITSPKSWRVQDNLMFVFSFFLHWCIWRRLENIFIEMPLFWWWATQEILGWVMRKFFFLFQLWGLTGWRITFGNFVPLTIFWCHVWTDSGDK